MLLGLLLVFREIAATVDGGAYLLSRDGSEDVLERVVLDGGRLRVRIDGAEKIEAIATRGDALWIVTADEVIVRARWASEATVRVEIPTNVQRDGVVVRDTMVTPLGKDRALVMRACGNALSHVEDCTEVIAVDVAAGTATARTWEAQLSNAVADERGGAWIRVEHAPSTDIHRRASTGYAHASGTSWDLWSFDGLVVPGMMAHRRTDAFPEHLAPAADGVLGISQHAIWPIDESGVPRSRMDYDEVGHRGVSVVHGAASSGGELVLLTGVHEVCCFTDEDVEDASPVLRWITRAGVERAFDIAPTPRWWRDEHRKGTPRARLAIAARVAWVLFEDLVMMRVPPGLDETDAEWRVVAERGAPEGETRDRSRHFWSFSGGLGYSRAGDDDGFAYGVRFERIRTADRRRPWFATGGYAEVSSLGGRTSFGSGLTLGVLRLGAVASAGASLIQDASDAYHPQLAFSLFLGKRVLFEDMNLEAPIGVRFEVRPGTSALPTTFMVATSLDLLVVSAVGLVAAAM